jgi:hypothetical protein
MFRPACGDASGHNRRIRPEKEGQPGRLRPTFGNSIPCLTRA